MEKTYKIELSESQRKIIADALSRDLAGYDAIAGALDDGDELTTRINEQRLLLQMFAKLPDAENDGYGPDAIHGFCY